MPWRNLGCLRISSAWEPTAGPADLKESGPAGAGEPGLEERLQRDPTPARGAPPGAMATGSRTPGPDPQPAPRPSSECKASLPALPPRRGPGPAAPPPPKMDSPAARGFERGTVHLEDPAGGAGPAPSRGTGPATTHLLKLQPRDGPGAGGGRAGGRGRGGGDKGVGD